MGIFAVFLIAISLAMDAFAVSVSNGISIKNFKRTDSFKTAVFFGGFQFIMPLAGYILASGFEKTIKTYDHWIAFILLAVIGINMIKESFNSEKSDSASEEALSGKRLLLQAVATSIDALAVGISFAAMGDSTDDIILHSFIIGAVAFLISYFGGIFGKKLGGLFQKSAAVIGGGILIAIGIKILCEHLFFL